MSGLTRPGVSLGVKGKKDRSEKARRLKSLEAGPLKAQSSRRNVEG